MALALVLGTGLAASGGCIDYDIEPKACDRHRPRAMRLWVSPSGDWPYEGLEPKEDPLRHEASCVIHGVDTDAEMISYLDAFFDPDYMPSVKVQMDCSDGEGEVHDVSIEVGVEGLDSRSCPFGDPGRAVTLRTLEDFAESDPYVTQLLLVDEASDEVLIAFHSGDLPPGEFFADYWQPHVEVVDSIQCHDDEQQEVIWYTMSFDDLVVQDENVEIGERYAGGVRARESRGGGDVFEAAFIRHGPLE